MARCAGYRVHHPRSPCMRMRAVRVQGGSGGEGSGRPKGGEGLGEHRCAVR